MGRILAIDYGRKRTGLAATDPAQIIANGLCTVETHRLWDYLCGYVAAEQVERIVIGMPTQTNGQPSENQRNIIPFINRWRKSFPQIPIVEWDERFTSVMAQRTMLDAGLGKMARRNKALVDEISATIILQSYMESKAIDH
ncbi:MAG: Holliday junction resolvase RuvX [Bacteroidaceae bacterium]|nr:Holliday junction resolvase RuvX [Bacteroidaceae bacterium]MBR3734038.1 Holliday junction resolvase RuvX [Bacteroidaceae bacterium]MBR4649511.1 Holliday junction resolvase RuvX [Bacteroidaceae bacterium]